MLPAFLVTLATYLLELSSSSPVYNMQPAFITNTLGATTGRNIRNLPCISRKNNNQHGVCMFAIDCLKANGTHLGTCIDRFYFGSCCHIEPLHDIIENTIESDIIPAREPPLRITNTTTSTTTTTVKPTEASSSIFNKLDLQSTTAFVATTTQRITSTTKIEQSQTSTKSPTTSETKTEQSISSSVAFGDKISTSAPSSTIEVTTVPQKLQTFQVVDGSTLPETTRPSITTAKPKPTRPSTKPTTVKPVTQKPTQVKPSTQKPATTKTTIKSTTKPTLKPKPTRAPTTTKPTKTPRPTTKPTIKITKPTSKPVRTTATTKKPITTKAPPTVRITKKPSSTTPKPTQKVTTASTAPTNKIKPVVTSTTPKSTSTTPKSTTTASTTTSRKPEITTKRPPVLTTTVSNEIPVKINVSQILQTVSGNPATNEIEAAKPAVSSTTSKPTGKPEVATWTVADNKNYTVTTTETALNVSTEDWVPITTPDGWVLLPSVPSSSPQSTETTSSVPSNQTTMSSSIEPPSSSTTESTVTLSSVTEGKPSITYIPLEATTQSVATSANMTSDKVEATITTTPLTETTTEGTTALHDRPVNMSDFTDVCGRRMFPEARIVGGEKSSFGKWPWQISLRQWRTSTYLHKCGAALLNENWAITAAHCVDNVPPSDLLLRLGEHDLSTESEPYLHQERRVQIVASHPQFDPRTFEYDLALLRFYEPVTFQPNILPVCVPQTDENFIGRTAYVTGWGRLYEDGPLPSVLQEVSVPVINNTLCEIMYRSAGYIEYIPHIFICAGWRRGGFDSCEGDSGGPMVIQREDKRFVLAGVISWGIGCAEPNQPGVYTRISEFRDWINQILQF